MGVPRRRQRPVKGGRTALPACVLRAVERRVRQEAWRHHASRSWVVAYAVAKFLGVEGVEDYRV